MSKGEDQKLMNGGQVANVNDDEGFINFLYNKSAGTVLGRTGKSWIGILVFYIIFYTFLAAFWLTCLWVFLRTLDPKTPRYYGTGTIIGVNPGLGYQPWLKENPDSTLIKFNVRDPESWKPYTNQIDEVLAKYGNSSNTRECGPNDTNDALATDPEAEACRFDLAQFDQGCAKKQEYGYKSGAPCVVVTLNRLIGWKPVDFPSDSVPEIVKPRYKKGSIAIDCHGANEIDKEHIGKLKYIPTAGIDGRFYPYVFTPSYQQPIAMVKFESLPRNKLVIIECRAYALNIEHDITNKLGLVYFELFVEDKPPAKKEL